MKSNLLGQLVTSERNAFPLDPRGCVAIDEFQRPCHLGSMPSAIKGFNMGRDSPAGESTIIRIYLPRLIRLAERNLSPQLRRKVDENDLSASVLRTVIRQARDGIIVIEESEDFWRQLIAITLNKARKLARYWKQTKRSVAMEIELTPNHPTLEELAHFEADLGEPNDDESGAFVAILEALNEQLDETCRNVLSLKLLGNNHLQIAEKIGVSPRSVTRYVGKIQETMRAIYDSDQ
jgi:DNA-directed RNA polymerase specialized sigma24 family protein